MMFMFFGVPCKRLASCLTFFFRLVKVSLYQGLLRFLFVLHRRFDFRLLLVQFVIKSLNTLAASVNFEHSCFFLILQIGPLLSF